MGVSDAEQRLVEEYQQLKGRHLDLETDPTLGMQAEWGMLRIEAAAKCMRRYGSLPKNCVTCGAPISPERRRVCPETIWCVDCVQAHEQKRAGRRRRPWDTT